MKIRFIFVLSVLFSLQATAQMHGHAGYFGSDKPVVESPDNDEQIKRSKRERGLCGYVEAGHSIGVEAVGYQRERINSLKLSFSGAYRFNPHFTAGIGVGIRYFYQSHISVYRNTTLLPVFADFRVNFLKKPVSPFLALAVGYSFAPSDGYAPFGVYFMPSVGVSLNNNKNVSIQIGIGYDAQHHTYTFLNPHFGYDEQGNWTATMVEEHVKRALDGICLNVGVSF